MWKHTEPTKICMYHAKWRNKNCNLCHEAFILGDDFKGEAIDVVILLKYWEPVKPRTRDWRIFTRTLLYMSVSSLLCKKCFFQVGLSWDTWNAFLLKKYNESENSSFLVVDNYINVGTAENVFTVLVLEFPRFWGDAYMYMKFYNRKLKRIFTMTT